MDPVRSASSRHAEDAFVHAYFTAAQAVFDHDVLRAVAASAGLDARRVDEVLASDEFADAVAADTAEARRLGVTGTPFFLIDGRYTHSGAQPAEVLGEALTRVLAETHPLTPLVDLGVGVGVVAPACGPAGCALD